MTRVHEIWTKGPQAGGDMESTSPFPGTGGDPAGFTHPCPNNGWKEAGEDTGAGTQQMHFITQPRGVCVCWGKGWLGVWVHLLPLPANAGSLCTHGRQGPKGTAHGSLDFYPAVQTGRRQIRVSVGISSCQRHPQPLWVGSRASSLQRGLSHTHGHPNTASFPPELCSPSSFPLEQVLASDGDAHGWVVTTPSPVRAGSHRPVPMWQ